MHDYKNVANFERNAKNDSRAIYMMGTEYCTNKILLKLKEPTWEVKPGFH